MRVRLDLGYDGTEFSGWAVQPGLRTVAGTLTTALATVLRVDPASLGLVVAGRTDAGVHAVAQVAHFEVPLASWLAVPGRAPLDPSAALLRRLHGVLPVDVRVHAVQVAPAGFDARFSALFRRYAYRVCDDPAGVPPLRRRDVLAHWTARGRLDLEAMNEAARGLIGLNDFAAFCRRRQGATTVRTLLEYSWARDDHGFAVARVIADAFCHSMVRALVGALLPVGEGRRPVGWPAEVLAGRRRVAGVTVASARGLTLEEVRYPPDADLAARAVQARSRRGPMVPDRG